MLSRRSVRVKIMQLFYALNTDKDLAFDDCEKRYWLMIEKSYDVFLYNLYTIIQITKIASEDEEKRKSKHLPTDFDKKFTSIFCENPQVKSLRNDEKLQKIFDKKGFNSMADKDHYRKIYNEFSKLEEYEKYILGSQSLEDHRDILLELYRFCRKNEMFNEIIEDAYLNWYDDKSLVVGAIKKVIKALPADYDDYYKEHYPDDETIKDYGETLFKRTYLGDEALLTLIKPVLTNWDHERLAIIDMILLKMATCEMINFQTIPAKVTLNEYVEVAKAYSTDKSKEFVNGVLDKLMKQLDEDGKLNKEGRGLKD